MLDDAVDEQPHSATPQHDPYRVQHTDTGVELHGLGDGLPEIRRRRHLL